MKTSLQKRPLRNYCVRMVNADGLITTVAGRGSDTPYDGIVATNAQLDSPDSVTLDATGNLVFSDYNSIRKLSTNGLLTRLAGTGYTGYDGDGGAATLAMLYSPSGVAVDPAGHVFIADMGNQRIRRVDTNGVITTVAGIGTSGYSGDGGAATNAQFNNPGGLAVNAAGDLFIADYGNHRIRKVSPFASLPTLTLNNLTTNHAGEYRVIVTGTSGSVTSQVVNLTVALGGLAITRNGANVLVSFPSLTGSNYQLESATNLPAVNWLDEGAPFIGTGGVLSTNVPVGPEPKKFFRLQLLNSQ